MTGDEKRQLLPRKFLRRREVIQHGRRGEGAAEQHEQWKGLVGRPGIVVRSPSLEVLHMHRQAHLLATWLQLLQRLNNRTIERPSPSSTYQSGG